MAGINIVINILEIIGALPLARAIRSYCTGLSHKEAGIATIANAKLVHTNIAYLQHAVTLPVFFLPTLGT
jgi:hypothetical protein